MNREPELILKPELKLSDKGKIQSDIETIKLQKELEAQKLGLASFDAFVKKRNELETKEAELMSREETLETRETIVAKREEDVARAGERNETVKKNLISKEIQDYKKAEAVRAYAFQNYFAAFDALSAKIYNGKTGKDAVGLIQKGKRMVDEPVAMDIVFQEELVELLKPIQTVLKKSPKFDSDTGEYLTEDDIVEELEEEDLTEAELTNPSVS